MLLGYMEIFKKAEEEVSDLKNQVAKLQRSEVFFFSCPQLPSLKP